MQRTFREDIYFNGHFGPGMARAWTSTRGRHIDALACTRTPQTPAPPLSGLRPIEARATAYGATLYWVTWYGRWIRFKDGQSGYHPGSRSRTPMRMFRQLLYPISPVRAVMEHGPRKPGLLAFALVPDRNHRPRRLRVEAPLLLHLVPPLVVVDGVAETLRAIRPERATLIVELVSKFRAGQEPFSERRQSASA